MPADQTRANAIELAEQILDELVRPRPAWARVRALARRLATLAEAMQRPGGEAG